MDVNFIYSAGRGSIDKLWIHGVPQHDRSGKMDWKMTCLLASARGAEIMPDTDTSRCVDTVEDAQA